MNVNFQISGYWLIGILLVLLAIIGAAYISAGDRPLRRFIRRQGIGCNLGKTGRVLHCVFYYSDGSKKDWGNTVNTGNPVLLDVTVSRRVSPHPFVLERHWAIVSSDWKLMSDGALKERRSQQYVKLRESIPPLQGEAKGFVSEVLAIIRGDYQAWLKNQLEYAVQLYDQAPTDDLRREAAESLCDYIDLSKKDGPYGWPFQSFNAHREAADRLKAELIEPNPSKTVS